MIPNPIQKVLSTLSTHQVRYLLMGGQACVFYGAAEFSGKAQTHFASFSAAMIAATGSVKSRVES